MIVHGSFPPLPFYGQNQKRPQSDPQSPAEERQAEESGEEEVVCG
jgi:hypothetical protein